MVNYFIFRCSNKTYNECLKRGLFGQRNNLKNFVSNVKKGDILFLHNVQTQQIEGPFFAKSNGRGNIIPDAWNGEFPQQVEVETKGKTSKIGQKYFDKYGLKYMFEDKFMPFQIPIEVGRKLVEEMGLELNTEKAKITNYETLNDVDVDIRLKYPANFRCSDGHYVRSKNEVIIDNWFYDKNITHAYEKRVIGENILCDFYLRSKDGVEVYVEVWGLDSEQYLQRKKEKIDFYTKNNLNLINIQDKNMRNIDDLLQAELKKYNLI